MINIKYPTTEKYLKELYEKLFSFQNNSDLLFLAPKRTGKSAYIKFFIFEEGIENLRNDYSDKEFIFFEEIFTNDVISFWKHLSKSLGIKTSENNTKDDLIYSILEKIEILTRKEKKTLVLVFDQPQNWPFFDNTFIKNLLTIKNKNADKIFFIFIQDDLVNIVNEDYTNLVKTHPFEELYLPISTREEVKHQIIRNIYKSKGIEINENDTIIDRINTLSGGISGIIRKLCDNYQEIVSKSETEILSIKAISHEIETILNDMPADYVDLLKENKHDQKLEFNGITDNKGNIKSSLIKEYLRNNLNPKEENTLLAYQEEEVYKHLLKEKGNMVTREDIARIIWKEDYLIRYSDWGIDSVISRIRKKIPEVNIQCLRKKGFLLKNK